MIIRCADCVHWKKVGESSFCVGLDLGNCGKHNYRRITADFYCTDYDIKESMSKKIKPLLDENAQERLETLEKLRNDHRVY